MIEELKIKQKRINELLNKKALDGVMLFRSDNFAWITGGASSLVNKFTDEGIAALLITRDRKYLILTEMKDWPVTEVKVNNRTIKRPGILIRQ